MKPTIEKARQPGFTLIELVVTISILSLILLMALQVIDSSRTAIRISESKSFNDSIARRAFEQIGRDFSQLLIREDARIEFKSQPGNDKISFLANNRGLTNATDVGTRPVSLLSYEIVADPATGQRLERGSLGHQFTDTGSDALALDVAKSFPAIPAANVQTLSSNILRFEVEYLIRGPSGITREITAPATSTNLRGFIVSLVTVDDRTRRSIRPDRILTIADKFGDSSTSTSTLKSWTQISADLSKNGVSGIPKDALQLVRCYQRTFLIQ